MRLLELNTKPTPQYECVSHIWGDRESTKSAIINEIHFTITKNPYDVLRYIRSKTKTIIIWADVICINQSDTYEKSRQAAFMAEIYRRCSKVHIWLGLTGNPFEFLWHFGKGRNFYEFPGFDRDNSTGRWTWEENKACSNILDDFLQVVKSPWWTRAWTVQECLLPKDSVIMFGTWAMSWDDMFKAEYMKNSHRDSLTRCCGEAVSAFTLHQLSSINEWLWRPSRGQKLMNILHGSRSPPCFYQTIRAFSSQQCLDPRDKIYSMLSLATHPIYQDFRPNYQEDVGTV